MIRQRAALGPVFFKDMSYYVVPHLLEDMAFCDSITHAFLIRDPVASIASYYRLDPEVRQVEIGLEAQWQHFSALRDQGVSPVVLLAEDIRANPHAVMAAYWRAVGLANAPQAFDWQTDTPQDWQQVAGWPGAVMASQGIKPMTDSERQAQVDRFEVVARARPDLRDLLEHHREFHQRLAEHALRPDELGEKIR